MRYTQLMILLMSCVVSCQATRVLLAADQSTTNATAAGFECGKANGPCGRSIPAGVTCPKGPGYCQPGYFCGWQENTLQPSKCLPLPANCGAAGNACCPSNTDSPHTSAEDKLTKKPFCKDGSTCFYFAPMPGLDNGDMYSANKGGPACGKVPADCATGPGSPCCPMPYHISANPPLQRIGCPDSMFCNYMPRPAGTPENGIPSGTCEPNPSDCGEFGKKCCVYTGGAATGFKCGAQYGQSGPKGYCANPLGYKGTGQAPLKDLICTQCPFSDKLDPSLEKTDPTMYFSCKTFS